MGADYSYGPTGALDALGRVEDDWLEALQQDATVAHAGGHSFEVTPDMLARMAAELLARRRAGGDGLATDEWRVQWGDKTGEATEFSSLERCESVADAEAGDRVQFRRTTVSEWTDAT